MKVETVVCDWCPEGTKVAVASPTLVVGLKRKGSDPYLDLCQGHLSALLRAFVPYKRTKTGQLHDRPRNGIEAVAKRYETKKERDRARQKRKHSPQDAGRVKAARHWESVLPVVLQAMPNGGQRLSRPAIEQLTTLSKSTTYNALMLLVERGKVKQHGPVGRYRTYERVAESA